MGNAAPRKSRTQTDDDDTIRRLGDRYPFGDDEIRRLARCHRHLRRARRARRSFLSDWAVYSAALPPDRGAGGGDDGNESHLDHERIDVATSRDAAAATSQIMRGRAAQLRVCEGRILPAGFGRRLERAAFLLRRDVVDYRSSDMVDSPYTTTNTATTIGDRGKNGNGCGTSPCCHGMPGSGCRRTTASTEDSTPCCCDGGEEEEAFLETDFPTNDHADYHDEKDGNDDVSFLRLEKFLEGAGECGRRGARASLTVLFKCCSRTSRGGYTADALHPPPHGIGTDGTNGASSSSLWGEPGEPANGNGLRANASEVLDLGYSLSLASAYLAASTAAASESDVDPDDYVPERNATRSPALRALADSLIEFAEQEKDRRMSDPFAYGSSYMSSGAATTSQHQGGCQNENGKDGGSDENGEMVTLDVFLEWAESVAPLLSACLSTFVHHILFPDRPHPPSRTPFVFPDLKGQKSAFFHAPSCPLLFSFACMSPSLNGSFFRIFSSDHDGLSFNRLQLSLLGYGGPTLLIIRSVDPNCGGEDGIGGGGATFGAFTGSPWKESKDYFGDSACFLFQLLPRTAVYRPSGNGTNFMYCNSEARSKGFDGLAHGIGFGGTSEQPRLYVAESFDGCVAMSNDLTFESGPLLPPAQEGGSQKYFDIETIEVWGVGGDEVVAEALGARKGHRELVASNIRKARKVDKAQFLEDFNSGIIESKAFKHREQVRGRADCHIDDKDDKNYIYE